LLLLGETLETGTAANRRLTGMTHDADSKGSGVAKLPGADRMRELTGRARETIDTARSAAGDALASTRAKGGAVVDDAREKAYRAADETNRIFQEHPITAVAAAVAAGAVIGIFMPRLYLTAKASGIAGRAIKIAATAEAAQTMISRLTSAGEAMRSGMTQAATVTPVKAKRVAKALANAEPMRAARRGAQDVGGRVRRATRAAVSELSTKGPQGG
jgi:ElaB/YqjD/DUF883 family membrane-anchored ribosome-binding protein